MTDQLPKTTYQGFLAYDWKNIFKIPDEIRTKSGVYGIYFDEYIIYVGLSNSIYQRIKKHFTNKKHIKLSNFLIANREYISVKLLSDKYSFENERKIIKLLNPVFNRDKR